MMEPLDVHWDMETFDIDDYLTLCFLAGHPVVKLRSVSVNPGSDLQVGLVHHVLKRTGNDLIPVGSFMPGFDRKALSSMHHDFVPDLKPARPDGLGKDIIMQSVKNYPGLVIITGAPLRNFRGIADALSIKKWVAQGGFAGDSVVPKEHRLEKFDGHETFATFNFGGDPKTAEQMLANKGIAQKYCVSKNVCHGLIYDRAFHAKFEPYKNNTKGLRLIYDAMSIYLEKRGKKKRDPGKKFHDPLAACAAINPKVCDFREVELYRERGKWGSRLKEGTNTYISIKLNRDEFFSTFTRAAQ